MKGVAFYAGSIALPMWLVLQPSCAGDVPTSDAILPGLGRRLLRRGWDF